MQDMNRHDFIETVRIRSVCSAVNPKQSRMTDQKGQETIGTVYSKQSRMSPPIQKDKK